MPTVGTPTATAADTTLPSVSAPPISTLREHLATIEEISDVLTSAYPECELALQSLDASESGVDASHVLSPLVDGEVNGLPFGAGDVVVNHACTSGVMIINVAVFDSVEARVDGLEYLGMVERPRLASTGITTIGLAWDEGGTWLAWVEKVDQPMHAASTAVIMSLAGLAHALGGESTTLEV